MICVTIYFIGMFRELGLRPRCRRVADGFYNYTYFLFFSNTIASLISWFLWSVYIPAGCHGRHYTCIFAAYFC